MFSRDLTERQRLDKQRDELLKTEQQLRRQVEQAHAMRTQFLAILSHELKNPLNLILMNTELIAHAPEAAGSAKLGRSVDIIRRTVRTQSQIIDDLLDLSRLHTGKLTLSRTAVAARPVIERLLEGVLQEAGAKRLAMSSNVDDLVVFADSVRLEQIVWNLVSNAVKFTPIGGRIEVGLARDGAYARLEVSDTGIGVDSQVIDQVFDLFSQGNGPVTARKEGGLGIGLALVRQLAELHGGRAEATSPGRNKGSTFTVWLPLLEGQLGAPTQEAGAALFGKRILLVEDNVDMLEATREVLTAEGATVTAAASGKQALDEAQAATFDLVISDIAMPDMDGYQLIADLRRRPHSAQWLAIAVSGFARTDDVQRARDAGFDAHLAKPLSLDALNGTYAVLVRKGIQ